MITFRQFYGVIKQSPSTWGGSKLPVNMSPPQETAALLCCISTSWPPLELYTCTLYTYHLYENSDQIPSTPNWACIY